MKNFEPQIKLGFFPFADKLDMVKAILEVKPHWINLNDYEGSTPLLYGLLENSNYS